MRVFLCTLLLATSVLGAPVRADNEQSMLDYLDAEAGRFGGVAHSIWEYAELGYQEAQSAELLKELLGREGFTLQAGVADIPTAFIASYGSGEPVIALLAEYDALPGISQSALPQVDPVPGRSAAHACGHHLLGTGSVAAAVALRHWLEANAVKGTVRLYGTPAEEGGSGKVYMVRAGLFDDVNAVLAWHPADRNASNPGTSLANKSAKFRFRGVSSHAAGAPERGRSALDAVEAMNFMVNMMREHVPQETRIHYVITSGGAAPNVVPDFAEVFYYVRHPERAELQRIWERVMQVADAAALGTGTSVSAEVIHGNFNRLANETLARLVHQNLERVGGVSYDAREAAFAEKVAATLGLQSDRSGEQETIKPMEFERSMGSTDVGDISWVVPTTEMRAATWVPGTSAHSWQAVAAGGTSIGSKGMLVAAKALALSGAQLFLSPALLDQAQAELVERRGADFSYVPLLGDRAPPLDFRAAP